MNCRDFNKIIYDYLEGELSEGLGNEVRAHLEGCRECRELYLNKANIREKLIGEYSSKGIELKCQRKFIMEKIDRNKYGRGPLYSFRINLKRHWIKYVSAAAAVIALLLILPNTQGYIRKLGLLKTPAIKNIDEPDISPGGLKIKGDGSIKIEGEPSVLENLISQMKNMPGSAVPWRVVYGDDNRVAFYNYSHLLMYRKNENRDVIYSAVNIQSLNLGSMQGSSVIDITPSPNGQFYLIGSSGMADDPSDKSIFVLDLINREGKLIGKEKLSKMVYGWSDNSRYFAIGDRDGKKIRIYDFCINMDWEVDFGRSEINNIFVSDAGTVFMNVDSTQKVYSLRGDNYQTLGENELDGICLGVNQKYALYYKSGKIYETEIGKRRLLKDFGRDLEVLQKSVYDRPFYTVFKDENKLKVYDIKNNNIYDFNYTPKEYENCIFSPGFSYLITEDGQIVNRKGQVLRLPSDMMYSGYLGLLDNEIIFVESIGELNLGDFEIVRYKVENTDGSFRVLENK